MVIPAGALVKVDVRAANIDPAVTGACPFNVDARRVVEASKAPDSLMSFGDGPHRCPGAAVALQETAIFLDRIASGPECPHISTADSRLEPADLELRASRRYDSDVAFAPGTWREKLISGLENPVKNLRRVRQLDLVRAFGSTRSPE